MKTALQIIVKGRVQGVGYRWFTTQAADHYGIKGTVKNLLNGDVEVAAQGDQDAMNEFVGKLRSGPSFSQVTDIELSEINIDENLRNFKVIY